MIVEDVLKALDWATHERLAGSFHRELSAWGDKSGIEMMGTEAIEAEFLADIVRAMLRDPKVIHEVIRNLAEIATTPVEHGGAEGR